MPDTVVSILHSQYISATLDLYPPEVSARLFRRHGDQGAKWMQTLEMLGYSRPTANKTYSLFEEGRLHETFVVRANVTAPGAGNDITLVLAAVSVDASNRFAIQVSDDVIFHGEEVGRVQSVDITTPAQPAVTIALKDITDDAGALVAGDELVIYSNSWGEASAQPNGKVGTFVKRTNGLKRVKTSLVTSGDEMTNETYLKVYDDTGKSIVGMYQYNKDILEGFRHAGAISRALLVDKRVTNTTRVIDATSIAGDAVADGTDGLIPVMRNLAIPFPVASGAMDIDDYYSIDLALTKEWAPANYMQLNGKKRSHNIEKLFFAANANTGIDYTNPVLMNGILGGGDRAQAKQMVLNFKGVNFAGGTRNIFFKEMIEFNDPSGLGAEGYGFMDMGVMIPMEFTVDAKSQEKIPYAGLRYKMGNGYNRRLEVWRDGAAGGDTQNYSGAIDARYDYIRSQFGAEFANVNRFVLIYAP